METMDAIRDALGPKIDQAKAIRIIAIFEHSGPEVLMREMLRSPRNPLLGV